MNSSITLVSTVVAPTFARGVISIDKTVTDLTVILPHVTRNLCGHPLTNEVLKSIHTDLPAPEKGFWDGKGIALAVRPKGGVRGAAQTGDTKVGMVDLEAVLFTWHPGCNRDETYNWGVENGERGMA
jgi:hypothetical protein